MRVSSIRWGVILIGIGLFFLAINLELLDSLVFPRLFSLWPVLLIAIGVELLFRHTRLYFLALLSPLLIAGAFIFAATATGDWKWRADEFWTRWTWNDSDKKIDTVEISDSSIKSLDIDLDSGPGKISLKPTTDVIFRARSEYFKRSPWIKQDTSMGVERIEYTNRERAHLAIFGLRMGRSKNDFEIANYLPLKAKVVTDDTEPDLDFSPFKLDNLTLDLRSSRAFLKLGKASDSINVTISGDTRNLVLTVPREYGMAIVGESSRLHNLIHESSLSPSGDGYYTSGYDNSPQKIRINLKAKIKSLSISRE